MAELLIAAAEEYKCINEEKLSTGDLSTSQKHDHIDSDIGPPPKGVCAYTRVYVCVWCVHAYIPVCMMVATMCAQFHSASFKQSWVVQYLVFLLAS